MTLHDAIDSLNHYRDTGRPTGGFLMAVLENDLMAAMGHADDTSRDNLYAICCYLYNDMPSSCWGSKVKVAAWLAAKMQEREASA